LSTRATQEQLQLVREAGEELAAAPTSRACNNRGAHVGECTAATCRDTRTKSTQLLYALLNVAPYRPGAVPRFTTSLRRFNCARRRRFGPARATASRRHNRQRGQCAPPAAPHQHI
jgi:hypothetical protein